MKKATILAMMILLSACHNEKSSDAMCLAYIPLKAQSKENAIEMIKIDRAFMQDADKNNQSYRVICE